MEKEKLDAFLQNKKQHRKSIYDLCQNWWPNTFDKLFLFMFYELRIDTFYITKNTYHSSAAGDKITRVHFVSLFLKDQNMTWIWKFKLVLSILPDDAESVREEHSLPETVFHAESQSCPLQKRGLLNQGNKAFKPPVKVSLKWFCLSLRIEELERQRCSCLFLSVKTRD